MYSYLIVGSGYRSEYFARIAKTYPELFRAMYLCRSSEKAERMTERTGVKASDDLQACLAFGPDFVVVCVDRNHNAEVAETWLDRGYRVLSEVPAGSTEAELKRIWMKGQEGKRIVFCEQYHRQPMLQAGLEAVRAGIIGKPHSLYLSLLHDYHGASLIRRCLDIPVGEAFSAAGLFQCSPAAETDSRTGASYDGRMQQEERTMVQLAFASGKTALYDFASVQYRSFIRSRHLTLRGERGEWNDTQLLWLDSENRPRRTPLTPEVPEQYRILDTQALRDRRRNWTAELAPDTVQDEFAIAAMLLDMGEGKEPYPLEEALEDAYYWLIFQQAVQTPGRQVQSGVMPWHAAKH